MPIQAKEFQLYFINLFLSILLHQYYITACICQPYHYHIHETLFSNCLETKVAMKLANQTNEASQSNIG